MRSSDGHYWIALDHVRALAALLVFAYHFIHWDSGYPVPHEGAPVIFPLALVDEGHTGVAIFMTLSGYLFAKLLDGKAVDYPGFIWNRFLRLAPLLALVFVVSGVLIVGSGLQTPLDYAKSLVAGLILPAWPNGGWSITVEMHFYLLLPLVLFLARKDPRWLLIGVGGALALRAALFLEAGSVEELAYGTLVGRIDQFLLGIFFFHRRDLMRGKANVAIIVALLFCTLVWLYAAANGIFRPAAGSPSASAWWIVIPTIEALAYGALIAWYDSSFRGRNSAASRTIARYGQFSYSIYLLHPYFVPHVADAVHRHIVPLDNFYVALAAAVLLFVATYPIAWLSYTFIERPALRYRTVYTKPPRAAQVSLA